MKSINTANSKKDSASQLIGRLLTPLETNVVSGGSYTKYSKGPGCTSDSHGQSAGTYNQTC